jgi:hypothetical protein
MASAPGSGWRLAYKLGWIGGLAIPLAFGMAWLATTFDNHSTNDARAVIGGAIGVLAATAAGLALAATCEARPAVHRALRRGGAASGGLAAAAAVALFVLAATEARKGGMFAGLVELILAWLAVFAAASGGAFWLAGVSGRNWLAANVTTAPTAMPTTTP